MYAKLCEELAHLQQMTGKLSGRPGYAYWQNRLEKCLLEMAKFRSLTEWELLCLGKTFTGYKGSNEGNSPAAIVDPEGYAATLAEATAEHAKVGVQTWDS